MQPLFPLDSQILLWIQEYLRFPVLDFFFSKLTLLGNAGIFWILLSLLLLFFPKYRKAGITSLLALLIGFLIVNVFLKNIVARTRPYEVIEALRLLIAEQSDFSFPSGHSSSSIASALSIYLSGHKRLGTALIILALLIAWSRLYVGVHYPSDVLAGLLLGILSASLSRWIVQYFIKKKGLSH